MNKYIYVIRLTTKILYHTVPGMPMLPDGVPDNFLLKFEALMKLTKKGKDQGFARAFMTQNSIENAYIVRNEITLKQYFDDLVTNKEEWVEFFGQGRNYLHTVQTIEILCVLATIYWKRGAYEACGQVIEVNEDVLEVYRKSCTPRGMPPRYVHNMEYQTNLVRFQMNLHMGKTRATIPPFREVLAYEARYQRMDFIETVLHLFDFHPTPRDIHAMPDRSNLIGINIIKESDWYMNGVSEAKDHLKLLPCDHCGKVEKAFHEFKTCQRCNKVAYCGKACQKQAWKLHKKTCGKKV